MSAIALSKRLRERGFVKEDTYKARGWRGLGLKSNPDAFAHPDAFRHIFLRERYF